MNMNVESIGDYVVDNEVITLDPDRTIAWRPGRVTYDWSATPPAVREEFGGFPPFDVAFLQQSLASLGSAVAG
ncbi:MAG: hypothetical protein ACTMHL_04615 [Janibacter sp.]